LTDGQTYKLDDFAGEYRATLPTRQPYASCFNFFAPAQNILKFFGSRTNGTFGFAASHETNALEKPKEPFFANALLNQLIRIITLTT